MKKMYFICGLLLSLVIIALWYLAIFTPHTYIMSIIWIIVAIIETICFGYLSIYAFRKALKR